MYLNRNSLSVICNGQVDNAKILNQEEEWQTVMNDTVDLISY